MDSKSISFEKKIFIVSKLSISRHISQRPQVYLKCCQSVNLVDERNLLAIVTVNVDTDQFLVYSCFSVKKERKITRWWPNENCCWWSDQIFCCWSGLLLFFLYFCVKGVRLRYQSSKKVREKIIMVKKWSNSECSGYQIYNCWYYFRTRQ